MSSRCVGVDSRRQNVAGALKMYKDASSVVMAWLAVLTLLSACVTATYIPWNHRPGPVAPAEKSNDAGLQRLDDSTHHRRRAKPVFRNDAVRMLSGFYFPKSAIEIGRNFSLTFELTCELIFLTPMPLLGFFPLLGGKFC